MSPQVILCSHSSTSFPAFPAASAATYASRSPGGRGTRSPRASIPSRACHRPKAPICASAPMRARTGVGATLSCSKPKDASMVTLLFGRGCGTSNVRRIHGNSSWAWPWKGASNSFPPARTPKVSVERTREPPNWISQLFETVASNDACISTEEALSPSRPRIVTLRSLMSTFAPASSRSTMAAATVGKGPFGFRCFCTRASLPAASPTLLFFTAVQMSSAAKLQTSGSSHSNSTLTPERHRRSPANGPAETSKASMWRRATFRGRLDRRALSMASKAAGSRLALRSEAKFQKPSEMSRDSHFFTTGCSSLPSAFQTAAKPPRL
mmetsp:Transcript_152683/g.489682  ORF Transcript_152683/g.489682 Transcript_152683/m.489682 type:complete len:324 (+) Transcript_152683:3613-4584(+)